MARPYAVSRMWPGQTVVIIGGGASLSLAQIRTIAMKRLAGRCRVIAVNDAVYPAWWADWLHGCDTKWWQWHIQEVQRFGGIKTTCCDDVPNGWVDGFLRQTGLEGFDPDPSCIRTGGNSVYQAMHIAVHAGAARIVLLGVDMHGPHWFGDHPDKITPNFSVDLAPHFETLKPAMVERGVSVVNASPGSALAAFPLVDLSGAL